MTDKFYKCGEKHYWYMNGNKTRSTICVKYKWCRPHDIQIQNESTFASWKNFLKSASTFLKDVQNMWCTSKLAKGKYLYLPQKPLIKSLNIHGCKTMFPFVVYKGKLVLPKNCDVRFEKLTPENWEIYLCS